LTSGAADTIDERSGPADRRLSVRLGERSYDIRIEPGALEGIGAFAARTVSGRRAMIVTHPVLARSYGRTVRESLERAGFRVAEAVIPAGEKQKSTARLTDLFRRMLAAGLDRRSALIAFGGGVVGDLGGLTAALFMRGIPYLQIPTTLLAMVDSSVGGKTAVDLDDAKNAVGAFYQPKGVLIDPQTLATLPKREIRAGLAEVIKYGLLGDAEFFDWIRENVASLLALDPDALTHAIRRSCEMKADLVERDEFDLLNLRASLNLGHTVGHALEALGGYRTYRHGEAVAVGMVAAARIAERTGVAEEPVSAATVSILEATGLPHRPKEPVDSEKLLAAMLKDKKTTDGVLNFILPRKIGAVTVQAVPASLVLEVVEELCAS
jgi:3-dehydroquinate synthase